MSTVLSVVKKHIRSSEKKALVKKLTVLVCNLTNKVRAGIGLTTNRVYITTKALKHSYDKRKAEEFDFIINNLVKIVKYPDKVFENKEGKSGDFCFLKKFKKEAEKGHDYYFCIFENTEDIDPSSGKNGMIYIISFYRLSDKKEKRKNYLSNYKLLWDWKDDKPSS